MQAAEKTFATFEITITNPGGHSSRPRADNAIYELSDAIQKIAAHRFPVQATPLTRSFLGALGQITPGEVGTAMRAFADSAKFTAQTFVAVGPDGLDPCDLRTAKGDEAVRAMIAAGAARVGEQGHGVAAVVEDDAAQDQLLVALWRMEADINNGGFMQFLCNWGDPTCQLALPVCQYIAMAAASRVAPTPSVVALVGACRRCIGVFSFSRPKLPISPNRPPSR